MIREVRWNQERDECRVVMVCHLPARVLCFRVWVFLLVCHPCRGDCDPLPCQNDHPGALQFSLKGWSLWSSVRPRRLVGLLHLEAMSWWGRRGGK